MRVLIRLPPDSHRLARRLPFLGFQLLLALLLAFREVILLVVGILLGFVFGIVPIRRPRDRERGDERRGVRYRGHAVYAGGSEADERTEQDDLPVDVGRKRPEIGYAGELGGSP